MVDVGGAEAPPPRPAYWGEEIREELEVVAGGVGDGDSCATPNKRKIDSPAFTVSTASGWPSNKPSTIPSVPARQELGLPLGRPIPRSNPERKPGRLLADDLVCLLDVVGEGGVESISSSHS